MRHSISVGFRKRGDLYGIVVLATKQLERVYLRDDLSGIDLFVSFSQEGKNLPSSNESSQEWGALI